MEPKTIVAIVLVAFIIGGFMPLPHWMWHHPYTCRASLVSS